MATETQEYLDAVAAAPLVTLEQVKDSVQTFLQGAGKVSAQVELWLQALQAAEITETDEQVKALLFEIGQSYGAISREAREAQRRLRDLIAAIRGLEDQNGRLNTAATAAGYTVQG